jgi:hypothetical protein
MTYSPPLTHRCKPNNFYPSFFSPAPHPFPSLCSSAFSQRAAMLQEKASSTSTPPSTSPHPVPPTNHIHTPASLPPHAAPMTPLVVAASPFAHTHSRSAADLHRERRQALKDSGVPLHAATPALLLASAASRTRAGGRSREGGKEGKWGGWLGGWGLVMAGLGGVAMYAGGVEEGTLAGTAVAKGILFPSSSGSSPPSSPPSSLPTLPAFDAGLSASQPVWLQRPRGL